MKKNIKSLKKNKISGTIITLFVLISVVTYGQNSSVFIPVIQSIANKHISKNLHKVHTKAYDDDTKIRMGIRIPDDRIIVVESVESTNNNQTAFKITIPIETIDGNVNYRVGWTKVPEWMSSDGKKEWKENKDFYINVDVIMVLSLNKKDGKYRATLKTDLDFNDFYIIVDVAGKEIKVPFEWAVKEELKKALKSFDKNLEEDINNRLR